MKDISVMIDDVKFNFRVGLVIRNNGRVLLEKGYNVDFSVIPGGRIKTLEDTKSALIREIIEELDVDISNENIQLLSTIENFFEMNSIKYHELYFVYCIDIDKTNELVNKENFINIDSKDSIYNWVAIDNLSNVKILPVELKEIIKSNSYKNIVVNEMKMF